MAPKRTTRSSPATTTTTTTPVTNAQLKALIDQGVADALTARDADRSQNGEHDHDCGTGVRRQAPPAYECTYQDDAVEFATELMDKKIRTFAEHQTKNKRKQDDNQQQENKRQNTGRAYTAGEKKPYGDLSHCALNETITMIVRVLLNATSAIELAIWPVTVGVLLLLTIKETSLAMNVEIKGTIRVISQS
nr:hypothetical protein [Tanacetum cinerariifolium]